MELTGGVSEGVLPEGVRKGDERLICLTEQAGQRILFLIERDQPGRYLRVAIVGGGCNGLSYKMRFAEAPKKGDILVESSGAKVLIDSRTALYIKGTTIDYSNKMIGGGFTFTNPNAKSSCSCGESFSV